MESKLDIPAYFSPLDEGKTGEIPQQCRLVEDVHPIKDLDMGNH